MNVTFQKDGTWTELAFECVQDCVAPPIVVNATVSPGANMQGSERRYTCNAGYSEINNAPMTVNCQQGGTWTDVAFECMQACADPPTIPNAAVDTGNTLVGAERYYSCNSGFTAVGTGSGTFDMFVQCDSNGTWTTATFQCVAEFVCPSDELSFHQGVLLDGTVFQFRALFDAYTDFDGAMVKCAAEGGNLYQILTLEKMNFTLELMACPGYTSNKFCIDGVYNIATFVWETTAGTPLPMTPDFWAPAQPDQPGITNCLWMSQDHDHKWEDRKCGFRSDYPEKAAYTLCEIL